MARFIINSKTISGRLHDEMVAMDLEKGRYFSLNPVATSIWEKLETGLTLEELCSKLMDEYIVDLEQCYSEVREHLSEMMKLGLIIRK